MQIDFALEIVFLLIWSVKYRYFKPTIKINLLELHYTYFFLSADSFKPKYLAVLWIVNIKSLRVQKVGKIFWYIYYAKKLSRYFQNQWTGDLEFTNRFFFLSWYSKNVYLCTCTTNSILWVMIWLVNKETALYICLILSFWSSQSSSHDHVVKIWF